MTVRSALFATLAALSAASSATAQFDGCTATVTSFGSGCGGLTLAVDALPCVPNTGPFQFVVTGIPAGTIYNAILADFVSVPPGIDLTSLGMPGCLVYVPTLPAYAGHFGFAATSPTDSFPSDTPLIFDTNWWLGKTVYAQAFALVPNINPFGAILSNGLELVGG